MDKCLFSVMNLESNARIFCCFEMRNSFIVYLSVYGTLVLHSPLRPNCQRREYVPIVKKVSLSLAFETISDAELVIKRVIKAHGL